jgi:hypothetical protein
MKASVFTAFQSSFHYAGTRKAKRKKKKEKRKREKVCEMNNAPYSSGKVVAPNKISAR